MAGKFQHPSGNPLKSVEIRGLSIPRVPYNEPLTPGLRKHRVDTTAIGFTHDLMSNEKRHEDLLRNKSGPLSIFND